jgi:hypothetical protein
MDKKNLFLTAFAQPKYNLWITCGLRFEEPEVKGQGSANRKNSKGKICTLNAISRSFKYREYFILATELTQIYNFKFIDELITMNNELWVINRCV